MRKRTTLDLEEELLRDAAAVLGTRRTTDTVHAALRDVVARRRRSLLAAHEFTDLTTSALDAIRAVRTFDEPPPADSKRTRSR